jgi:hypothetical protein
MSTNTDLPAEDEDQTGPALAYVCSHLADLRVLLPDSDGAVALHELVTSVASAEFGQDLGRRLDALHRKVQAAGDALGVWGHVADARRDLNLPGVSGGGPFEPIYLCPVGQCSGRQVDQTTVFPLVCEIAGRELDQDVL